MIRAGFVALGLAGCLHPAEVACGDGRVCPQGTQCDDLHHRCVTADETAACSGLADGAHCSVGGNEGICDGGVCVLGACGDGIRNGTEDCDGADLGGADCRSLGYYDAPGLACTDYCKFDVSQCTGFCGDGIVNGNELCDGGAPPGQSCVDFGFDVGVLGCRPGACAPDFSSCGFLGWVQTPMPDAFDLTGVWVFSPRDAYAVGNAAGDGYVWHYDGARWTRLARIPQVTLRAVTGSAGDDLYAVGRTGSGGFVLHSTDGVVWNLIAMPTGGQALEAAYALSASDIYVAGAAGTILHCDHAVCTPIASATTVNLEAIWARNPDDVWAAGFGLNAADITVVHDRGFGFQPQRPSSATIGHAFEGITGTPDGSVYVTQNDQWWRCHGDCANGGGLWQFEQNVSLGRGAWAHDSAFISLVSGGIAHTTADGAVLLFGNLGLVGQIQAIAGDPAGHAFAVGDAGVAVRFTGTMWDELGTVADIIWAADATHVFWAWNGSGVGACQAMFPGGLFIVGFPPCSSPHALNAISGSSPTNMIAVGDVGSVVRWNGTAFATTSIASADLFGVWTSDATTYAVGANGNVWFAPAGGGFTQIVVAPPEDLRAVWGASDHDIYAVGANGRLLHGTGGSPVAFTATTLVDGEGVARDLFAVWGSSATDVWAAGASGTLLHSVDGVTWTPIATGTKFTLRAIWGSGPDDVFVAGDGGTIYRYDGRALARVRAPDSRNFMSITGDTSRVYFAGQKNPLSRPVAVLDRTAMPATCTAHETSCSDGIDDDCDFLVDCDDPDCAGDPACR